MVKKKFVVSFLISILVFSLFYSIVGEKILLNNETIPTIDGINKDDVLDLGEDNVIEQYVKNELLFLMMGVDSKNVEKSKGTRTDTLMLFKVNFDTGEIDLLSIPRDTRVLIKGKKDKINHAHSNGGVNLTINSLRDFLNLDIDYYVKVDYKAVMTIVDAIGGVKIDVPRNMRWYDPKADPPLDINIKKGEQLLDGKNAHDFLRWRKNMDGTGYSDGDIGRIKAQQMFVRELIKQTLQLKNVTKLVEFIKIYYEYVETNIPLNIILKGVKSAGKIDFTNINTNTIPGYGEDINGTSYWIYNREETDKIVEEMFEDYLLNN